MRFTNKIALITCGARGIGAATAKLFKSEGSTVIIVDILQEKGQAFAQENDLVFYHMDVSSEEAWIELTYTILSRFGHIDILFNNAGIIGADLGAQDPEKHP